MENTMQRGFAECLTPDSLDYTDENIDFADECFQLFPKDVFSIKKFYPVSLKDIIKFTKTGKGIKRKIENIRRAKNKEERKKIKATLPHLCLSVQFGNTKNGNDNLRHLGNVVSHTWYIQGDFDYCKNLPEIMERLKQLPFVVCIMISPSGNGVKVIFAVKSTVTTHEAVWDKLNSIIEAAVGKCLDPDTRQLIIPFYLTHDPDIWVNENPRRLDLKVPENTIKAYKINRSRNTQKKARNLSDPILPPDFSAGVWKNKIVFTSDKYHEAIKIGIVWALRNVGSASASGNISAVCPSCGKEGHPGSFFYNPHKYTLGAANCFSSSCKGKWNGEQLAKQLEVIDSQDRVFVPNNPPKISESVKDNSKIIQKPQYVYCHPGTGTELYGKDVFYGQFNQKKGKRDKSTPWARLESGSWLSGLAGQKPKFLFGLHKHQGKEIIIITEGEKKAESLNTIFSAVAARTYLAVSLPEGKRSRILSENLCYLEKKKVYVSPDYDDDYGGQQCMIANLSFLKSKGIDAHILDFAINPTPVNGYDIGDMIKALEESGSTPGGIFARINSNLLACSDSQDKAFIKKFGITIKNGVFEFETKYLSEILDPKSLPKYPCIEAIHGGGKTELAKEIQKDFEKVLLITNRQSLSGQLQERFGYKLYSDLETDPVTQRYRVGDPKIVITLDSLYKLPVAYFENCLIILDEIDQLASHLFGKTCKGERVKIIKVLNHLMKKSDSILAMSADITDPVKRFLEISGKQFTHYRNLWRKEGKAINIADKNGLCTIMDSHLAQDKKIAVACTEKKWAYVFYERFCTKYPGKKFLNITSNESKSSYILEILKNPDKLLDYDGVFFSPAIFSGVDFNIPEFETVFLCCTSNRNVPATELMQAISRFRQAETIYYFVTPAIGCEETSKEEIRTNCLDVAKAAKQARGQSVFEIIVNSIDLDSPYFVAPGFEDWFDLYAEVQSDRNSQLNYLKSNFEKLLKKRGFTLSSETIEANIVTKIELKMAKEQVKADDKNGVLNAQNIEGDMYRKIKDNGHRDRNELYEMIRHEIIETNGGEEELSEAYDIGPEKLRPAILALENIRKTKAENIKADEKRYSAFVVDTSKITLLSDIRRDVLAWPEVSELMKGGEITRDDYPAILARIDANRKSLSYLGFRIQTEQKRIDKVTKQEIVDKTPCRSYRLSLPSFAVRSNQ